ncbi:MAG: ribonuclease R [Bacteroidota bacterium]
MSKRRKKTTVKGKKLSSNQLKREVFKIFRRHAKKRFTAKQVIKKLKIANNKDSVSYALSQLAEEQQLVALADHKYQFNQNGSSDQVEESIHEGDVDMTRTGSAYIICADLENDVYVSAKDLNAALNGDRVRISVKKRRGRHRPEGKVIKVLERATDHFLGTLHISRKYAIVIPDRLNMPVDIYVDLDDLNQAQDGDKVVVKIVKWPTRKHHSPIGVITSALGAVGSNDIEMKSILINNGFELEFSEEVMKEAQALSEDLTEEEYNNRRDMRDVTTFTIDPVDARDFDDALSLRHLEDGAYEVGVHIADVTHYVHPGTALDKEAYRRSTSVYLVDRVLPMLPERLSNELCSLRPNEDKRTFSAVFEFSKEGKLRKEWFGKTLIHSDRRFAYGEAQKVLESGQGDFAEELKKLNELAKALRKQRYKNGAISFEAEEVRFKLDEEGTPVDVFVKERKDAHLLIEDFMLLANRKVAAYIAKLRTGREIPFVYRVHDTPNMERLSELALFAKELDFQMNLDSPANISESFNRLAMAARENNGLKLLEPMAIRTMAKAEYSTDNIGHYGLGFEYYTHFTSPIRRYSDVLAHRILEKNLQDVYRVKQEELEEQCQHVSKQERRATDAERESIRYKQVEYIEKHLGEVFPGLISGFHDRGIFVELEHNKCEGMISFEKMEEAFEISHGRLSAVGQRSGQRLRMGDPVMVKITRADLAKRQIEMEWAEEN